MTTGAEPSSHDFARGWLRRIEVRHVVTALAIVILAWLTSPIWLRIFPATTVYFLEMREARGVIEQIEARRRSSRSLPADLCALGLRCDEAAPLCYGVHGDHYVISFGTPIFGFFTRLIYESETGKWHEGE